MNGLVLSYSDAVTAGPAVVGAKGWNLGCLHRYGFTVPSDGVLVADAYTCLIDDAVACAVVFWAMAGGTDGVPLPLAGIEFSCDRRSGSRDRVTISAAPGLRDRPMSGLVNPEEIMVATGGRHLHILSRSRED